MYNIPTVKLVERKFYVTDPKIVYTCIGYGDATETGRLLIVGEYADPTRNNEITIRTFRDNEVHFTS